MFESLSDRLGKIFEGLRGRGALNESDVDAALREVRRALLEADVSLEVVKAFVEQVRERAVGTEVTRSVTPGQQVVKIVHDELVKVLGETQVPIDFSTTPPMTMLMVGLQGAGKTTLSAKLAKRMKERQGKKVLMASLDDRRPAAKEQLRVLGEQIGVDTLPIQLNEKPVDIARRAQREGKLGGYDVLILDTAGRTHIDEELMEETAAVKAATDPHEILLVADSLTGQDAVNLARSFDQRVDITGIVLTRVDGDGRGGAALSMRAATGKPIKLIGTGEKMDALEDFHPSRIADRILGMGDIVSLVEKAAQNVTAEDAAKMAKKLKKGVFDLEDLRGQLLQMKKMGGMGSLMNMMPGMGQMKKAMAGANIDEKVFDRQIAVINSMTKAGAGEPGPAERQAAHPHRQWFRHQGRRRQQADEAAPPDGGHDEEGVEGRHGFARRHVRRQDGRHDAGAGQHAGSLEHGPQGTRAAGAAHGDRPGGHSAAAGGAQATHRKQAADRCRPAAQIRLGAPRAWRRVALPWPARPRRRLRAEEEVTRISAND
jgi:signal recognition particle subunit SRP54